MKQMCQFCFCEREISDLMLGIVKIKRCVLENDKITYIITEQENYYCRDKCCLENAKLVEEG